MLGFTGVLNQCSDQLRNRPPLLPEGPVAPDQPVGECRDFLGSEDGKAWLESMLDQVEGDLEQMLTRMSYFAPDVERVLAGYPRLVPKNTTKCLAAAHSRAELPFADIPQEALPLLDQVQKRLDDRMKQAAADNDADFVDLYAAKDAAHALRHFIRHPPSSPRRPRGAGREVREVPRLLPCPDQDDLDRRTAAAAQPDVRADRAADQTAGLGQVLTGHRDLGFPQFYW
ncbi:SGNH/GDSL hydrolase family protein [Streptomyces dioscori]|uniref:hypothetical protein n=1 Tax=Streptomyces dioscori TaxID=2109333 RepID=UPI00131C1BD5|nr:hypothetical protein [Streptomyces dioscori]